MGTEIEIANTRLSKRQMGAVLDQLVKAGKPNVLKEHNKSILPGVQMQKILAEVNNIDNSEAKYDLETFLSILKDLGLIEFNYNGEVYLQGRGALFAIACLAKFFQAGQPLIQRESTDSEVAKNFTRDLTKAFEEVRSKSPQIDQKPTHNRKIVNVAIRAFRVRNFVNEDVFLCVLHPEWKKYHLVGESYKGEKEQTDIELAQIAMKKQLSLDKEIFDLMNEFRPVDQPLSPKISATNGSLCEYTFQLRAVKDIRIDLSSHLLNLISTGQKDVNDFRWFTLDEIRAQKGANSEAIMDSTSYLLTNSVLESIPRIKQKVWDPFKKPSVLSSVGNRVSLNQILPFLILALGLLGFGLVLNLLAQASPQDSALNRANSIFSIADHVFSVFIVLFTVYKTLKLSQR